MEVASRMRGSSASGSTMVFLSLRAFCMIWYSNMRGVRRAAVFTSRALSSAASSTFSWNRRKASACLRGELITEPLRSCSLDAVQKVPR